MASPVQALLRTPAALKQLTAGRLSARRLDPLAALGPGGEAIPVETYVSGVLQALAVFRFLSFSLGAGLEFFLHLSGQPPLTLALQISVVGVYNVVRITLRFRPADHGGLTNGLVLGSDLFVSIALVLITKGLDSAFLVYSLAPILTASLLMDARSAISAAAVLGLSISGAYVLSGIGVGAFEWILDGNYLVFSLLYLAVCLLIAYLPFLSNLNWQARVRNESVVAERRRLHREVHDNVAQTLAFLSLKVKRAEEKASSELGAISNRDVVEIRSAVERAYLAVRDFLDDTAGSGSGESLRTDLAVAARRWSRDTGLPVQLDLDAGEDHLPQGTRVQLIQIAREALANVAKHANARHVWVQLKRTGDDVALVIRDDGRGFSSSQPRGHGLDIVDERAVVIGASVSITSVVGSGTEVLVLTCVSI